MTRIAFLVLILGCAPALQQGAEPTPIASDGWTCASASFQHPTQLAHVVWRATITQSGDFDVALTGGLEATHPDTIVIELDEPRELAADGLAHPAGIGLEGDGVEVSLAEDAVVRGLWVGTIRVDDLDAVQFSCWDATLAPTYEYAGGACDGWNPIPMEVVRETGLGQCVDFAGIEMEEQDYSYPVFANLDLRGANLNGAGLHFAHFEDARFEGAAMTLFDFGYARLEGSVDEHTQLHENCEPADGRIDCSR